MQLISSLHGLLGRMVGRLAPYVLQVSPHKKCKRDGRRSQGKGAAHTQSRLTETSPVCKVIDSSVCWTYERICGRHELYLWSMQIYTSKLRDRRHRNEITCSLPLGKYVGKRNSTVLKCISSRLVVPCGCWGSTGTILTMWGATDVR